MNLPRPRRPLRYWLKLAFFSLALILLGFWIISVAALVASVTVPLQHPICCETPASFGAEYESVSFTTADNLTLRGWYIPPQNGAVIILLHPYYGDRRSVLEIAKMLYKHGYGLLLYDQRASGESEGSVRSLGWLDIADVQAAANLVVTRQKDIKIGISGCSVGGAIALGGTANHPQIGAVATDAPSSLSWDEYKPQFTWRAPFYPLTFSAYFHLVALRAGSYAPFSTHEAIRAIAPRPILFISTGSGAEKNRIQEYYESAPGPKWQVNFPTSNHCASPLTHPAEYEQTLVEFFNIHLSR